MLADPFSTHAPQALKNLEHTAFGFVVDFRLRHLAPSVKVCEWVRTVARCTSSSLYIAFPHQKSSALDFSSKLQFLTVIKYW